jgi:Cytidylate kinase-like family
VAADVVCISRSVAVGGEEIGRLLAEQLCYRYVDEEIVVRAAEREGLDVKDVASAEQRKSWLARFFDTTGGGGREPEMSGFGTFGSLAAGEGGSSEIYRALIKDAVVETAERGAVVIVAHAASYALAGREGILRVLVTASPSVRSRRLAERLGVDEDAATKKVKESDAARADYLKRFYGVDHELPTHYDLVINTDTLHCDQAAALIFQAAGAAPSRVVGQTR